MVEALTGLLFGLAAHEFGLSLALISVLVLISLVVALAGIVKMLERLARRGRLRMPDTLKVPAVFGGPAVGLDIDRGALKAVQVSGVVTAARCSMLDTAGSR